MKTLLIALVVAMVAPLQGQQGAPAHYTVMVGSQPVTVWYRAAAHAKGSVLLVHGRTWSALPDFDLQVPGESRSVMGNLAARGYDSYAVDLRGYGATPRDPSGWDTPQRAADDLEAVLIWMRQRRPHDPVPALVGWSNGSMVSQLLAQQHPGLISALVLYGYPWPGVKITADPSPARPERIRTSDSGARSDFIAPKVTSPAMVAAYSAAATRADPIRTDWHHLKEWNALNPAKIHVRTLLLQGELDPLNSHDVLARFFAGLGTTDKSWVTLIGGDHASLLEDTKPAFVDAIVAFLEQHP